MPTSPPHYKGKDLLDVMTEAHNYNLWIEQWILSSLHGNKVLDFGAGTGLFAQRLTKKGFHITCVESDPSLSSELKKQNFAVYTSLNAIDKTFDSIYSVNVLEHIKDDQTAAQQMVDALNPQGRLLIYVPAFSQIYSPLDQKIGHHRRYTQKTLCQLFPHLKIIDCRYVDSIGFLASLYLKHRGASEKPVSRKMVRFYDRWVFPLSRRLDHLSHRVIGKNVCLVAQKK